ncbi:hypothetical protein ACLOJK_006811, partial [Asimina triloba]
VGAMGDQVGSSLCDTVRSIEPHDNDGRRELRASQNPKGQDNTLGTKSSRQVGGAHGEPGRLPA